MTKNKFHQTKEELDKELRLVKKAQRNSDYFEYFYDKYFKDIFRFVYVRFPDKIQAQEITQDVFYKALLNLKKFKSQGVPFASWLYRIARNAVVDYARLHQKKREITVDKYSSLDMEDETTEALAWSDPQELGNLLNTLDEEDLMLIEMRYYEKLSFQEVAEITGMSLSNAKVKVHRILQRLKKKALQNSNAV